MTIDTSPNVAPGTIHDQTMLAQALNAMEQGICIVDSELRIANVNRCLLEMIPGAAERYRIGADFRDIVRHNARAGHYGPGDTEMLAEREIAILSRFEAHRRERTESNGRMLEIVGLPVPGGGFVTTFTDVTARRQAQRMSERLGRILDQSHNEIYVLDPDSLRCIEVNDGACRNTGYAADELTALTLFDLADTNREGALASSVEAAKHPVGRQVIVETAFRRKDGTDYPVELSLQMFSAETPPVFVVIAHDITRRSYAERALRSVCGPAGIPQSVLDGAPVRLALPEAHPVEPPTTDAKSEPTPRRALWRVVRQVTRSFRRLAGRGSGRSLSFDLWSAGLITVGVSAALGALDFVERWHAFTRSHEYWELDELVGVAIGMLFGVLWLSLRRERQGRQQLAARARAEQRLRESEKRFRDYTETASDWFWEMDENLRFTDISVGVGKVHGVDTSGLLGQTRWDGAGADPEQDPLWREHRKQLEAWEPFRDFRYAVLEPSGRLRHLRVSGKPVFNLRGKFAGYRGTTAVETAEVEARLLADRHRAELEAVNDAIAYGVLFFDRDLCTRYANRAAREMWQWSEAFVATRPTLAALMEHSRRVGLNSLSADEWEAHVAMRVAEVRSGSISASEIVRSDGSVILLECKELAEGERLLTFFDITERRQAEQAQQESWELLRSIADNSPTAISLKDTDGRYFFINNHFESLIGAESVEVRGKTTAEVFEGDFAESEIEHDCDIIETRQASEREEELMTASGRRTLLTVKFPILNPAGDVTAVGAISTDITDRKLAEERVRQAQKMEALGEMAGGVAHEFNNFLTSILGFARMAQRQPDDRGRVALCLEEIAEGAARATEVSRSMLAFSHKTVVEHKVIRVAETIRDLETLLRAFVEEHITLEVEVATGDACIEFDPTQLSQILVNLVSNARYVMPDGGSLKIRCENRNLTAPLVDRQGDALPAGRYVCIEVADCGAGMPPDVVDRIFDPFFTTKNKGEGTGLGLSLVYGIVRQAGGAIHVTSTVGEGSVFSVFLPASCREPSVVDGAAEREAELDSGGRTILVAEDDAQLRNLVRATLEDIGYRVLIAVDGEDAVGIYDDRSGDIDLLVTDVIMPNMGGLDLARVLTAKRPDLKVVYMSGYAPELTEQIKRIGDDFSFLRKPFEPDALSQMVCDVLSA